jgi:hypothetical protein
MLVQCNKAVIGKPDGASRALDEFSVASTKGDNAMRKIAPLLVLTILFGTISVSLSAHHGAAAFDTSKKLVLKGTVTDWLWSNPHCLLRFDVTGENGEVTHWIGETQNPVTMANGGWGKFSFKKGDVVTITLEPVKAETKAGRIVTALLPSGELLNASAGLGSYK